MEEKEQDKSIVLTAGVRLVDARMAAEVCGVSARFWHQLNASGKVPKPLKLGRRCLWSLEELDRWIRGGCPERGRWDEKRAEKIN